MTARAVRQGSINICMEYMDGGSLSDLLRALAPAPVAEQPLAYICRSLLHGLSLLRSLKLVHRDLKPQNVLTNLRGEVKVADFGCVASLGESEGEQANTFVGSLP